MNRINWVGMALVAALTGCGRSDGGAAEAAADSSDRSVGVVDSVFPMEVMLARFRSGIEMPSALITGEDSRDGLVRAVVDALAAGDTLRFERLTVSLPEFAWLYFPTSKEALPPYELPPALAWFRLQEGNRKGVTRALREFGGREIDYRGYTCGPTPTESGENRMWIGCQVTLARESEKPIPIRLFSAILERDGRYSVLSFDNDF